MARSAKLYEDLTISANVDGEDQPIRVGVGGLNITLWIDTETGPVVVVVNKSRFVRLLRYLHRKLKNGKQVS